MSQALKAIGEVVRSTRQQLGIRQGDLAARMRSNQTRVSRIEKGMADVTITELEALDRVLGLPRGGVLRAAGRIEHVEMDPDLVLNMVENMSEMADRLARRAGFRVGMHVHPEEIAG
jgi:transcriptional regulator with XRE-family HTH domain